jgi:hypothetical protein
MIIVRTPNDELFNYTECEEMYELNKELVGDGEFSDIVKQTYFFSFYDLQTGSLIGCIYFYLKGSRMYVNAFAGRKTHKKNLECLKTALSWCKRNVYAKTKHKTAKLCLLRCGFEEVSKNLYKYRRK